MSAARESKASPPHSIRAHHQACRLTLALLDEAAKTLESETKRPMPARLERLHDKLPNVVIAHRLTTVRQAGSVIVIEQRRTVESGLRIEWARRENDIFRRLTQTPMLEASMTAASSTYAVTMRS